MKPGVLPNDSAIVLDTNVISHSKRHAFSEGMVHWMDACVDHKNELIIPQVVMYESLRNVEDAEKFQKLQKEFELYTIGECTPEVFRCALYLNILYHQLDETKEFARRKDILNDLLVGAIAGKHEMRNGKKTFIASCDCDFYPPYFLQYSYHPIPHDDHPEKMTVLYLYEVNIAFANEQWRKFIKSSEMRKKK